MAKKEPKTIHHAEIYEPYGGKKIVRKGHKADVTPGFSVSLFGVEDVFVGSVLRGSIDGDPWEHRPYHKTFRVGDKAVYHSFNFISVGVIVSIGEKTITIREGNGKNHRLTLERFDHHNWKFDLEKIEKQNARMMEEI